MKGLVTRRDIVALAITPIVAALLCGCVAWVFEGRSLFAPLMVAWIALIPGYLVMFFIALPLYVWIKVRYGIGWKGILVGGAGCGSLIPIVIYLVALLATSRDTQQIAWWAALVECAQLTFFGATAGLVMATTFKVLTGRGV